MPQGVAMRRQGRFHLGPGGAGAKGRNLALAVKGQQCIHAGHIDGQYRATAALRVDVTHHGGAAAIGYDINAVFPRV